MVGLHFLQILSVWQHQLSFKPDKIIINNKLEFSGASVKKTLIFKPNTIIIINHQLEFSGTRVKYLDHEKRAYKHGIWS